MSEHASSSLLDAAIRELESAQAECTRAVHAPLHARWNEDVDAAADRLVAARAALRLVIVQSCRTAFQKGAAWESTPMSRRAGTAASAAAREFPHPALP